MGIDLVEGIDLIVKNNVVYKKTIEEMSSSNSKIGKPVVILSGGEVEIKLPENHGKGGRNSQFSLVLSKVIEGMENVDKIKRGDENNNGAVKDPDKIISFKSL